MNFLAICFVWKLWIELRQTSVDVFGDRGDTHPPVHQDNLNSVEYSEKHPTDSSRVRTNLTTCDTKRIDVIAEIPRGDVIAAHVSSVRFRICHT